MAGRVQVTLAKSALRKCESLVIFADHPRVSPGGKFVIDE